MSPGNDSKTASLMFFVQLAGSLTKEDAPHPLAMACAYITSLYKGVF